MRRRAYLALAGSALAGCSGLTGSNGGDGFGTSCPVDPSINPGTAEWPTATGDSANTRSVPRGAAPEPPLSMDWTLPLSEYMGASPPAVADGTVYATNFDTALHAVDAESGRGQWEAPGTRLGAPVVADEAVAVVNDEGRVAAFDRGDGAELWTAALPADVSQLFPTATVADGAVLVPTELGLSAFEISSGEERWRYDVGLSAGRYPAVADGTVVAAGGDAYVHAVDAETGERRWWYKAQAPLEAAPSIAGGTVYAGTVDGAALALDAETGRRQWRTERDGRIERLAVDGGRVYVGGDGALEALRAEDGTPCWRFGAFDPSYAGGMAASPDRIYVTAAAGTASDLGPTLAALDPASGDVQWRGGVDGRITSGPAVVDGAVYAGGHVRGTGLATFRLS